MNKHFIRRLEEFKGLLWKYVHIPHFWFLLIFLILVYAFGAIVENYFLGICFWPRSLDISLVRLFDFGMVTNSIGWDGDKWISLFEFLITWLIGSGIVLTVLVDGTLDYFKGVNEGKIRYKYKIKNHAIILGWNSSALVHIKEILDYKKQKRENEPDIKTIIILSECTVDIIKSQIETIDNKRLKEIEFLFYHGKFDSKEEFYSLDLNDAIKLYLVGEQADSSDIRDTRTLLTLEKIEHYYKNLKNINTEKKKLNCYAWLSKFSLYHQLIATKSSSNYLKVRYLNYYVNWAYRLWGLFPSALTPYIGIESNPLINAQGNVRLLMVGFSQMGQAIVEFLLKSGYIGSDSNRKIIFDIVDRKINERKEAFEKLFPSLCEDWKCLPNTLSFDFKLMDVHKAEFDSHLRFVYGRHLAKCEQLIIVLACDDADDMMSIALAIQKSIGKDIPIFVRQNLSNGNSGTDENISLFEIDNIYPFGSMSGAGYNHWRSVELCDELKNLINKDNVNCGLLRSKIKSYCEAVPSIFAAAGYLLCERKDGEDIIAPPDVSTDIYHFFLLKRLLAQDDMYYNHRIKEKWGFSEDIIKYKKLQDYTVKALANIGYSFKQKSISARDVNASDDGQIVKLGKTFLRWYGHFDTNIKQQADQVRNHYISDLNAYAVKLGEYLVELCNPTDKQDVNFTIGGSVAYNALLKDKYDIDIRLLINGDDKYQDVRNKIDDVVAKIVNEFQSLKTIKDKYIFELERVDQIQIENETKDVFIHCNVQAKENYDGLASIAEKLPDEIKDRLIISKSIAFNRGHEDYLALKRHWKRFLLDLKYDKILNNDNNIENIIVNNGYTKKYPLFCQDIKYKKV